MEISAEKLLMESERSFSSQMFEKNENKKEKTMSLSTRSD